jgi:hypothetical protein
MQYWQYVYYYKHLTESKEYHLYRIIALAQLRCNVNKVNRFLNFDLIGFTIPNNGSFNVKS